MSVSQEMIISHLFCTLISENQGLDILRSVSNLIKISVPVHLNFFSVHLNFFSVCHLNFFQVYGTNLKKIQLTNWKKFRSTEKKIRCAGPEIFLRFETDLNFSRPWFSEMKVQIKWPNVWHAHLCPSPLSNLREIGQSDGHSLTTYIEAAAKVLVIKSCGGVF